MDSVLRLQGRIGPHTLLITATALLLTGWAVHVIALHKRLASARHDPLTGLLRRDAYIARAHRLLSRHGDDSTVIMVDADRFKQINDGMGHAAGDAVLASMGARLITWAGPRAAVGRLGGDEFAMVLKLPADCRAFRLEQLVRMLHTPVTLDDGRTVEVAASIGAAAPASVGSRELTVLQRAADAALYEGKYSGRAVFATVQHRTVPSINGRRAGRSGTSVWGASHARVNDALIPVAKIRAAQNTCLEQLGLDPVSETEFENMHHHSGDDFMTEYRYNRRGTADRLVGTVTEWVRVDQSVEATKREVRIGGADPDTYTVIEMPKGTYDGAGCCITLDGKYIARTATFLRALYLIQRHYVYGTVEHHEIMNRPMFMEHMGDGLDILVAEGPNLDIARYPDGGSFMFTYINDYDPCRGEYSYLANDNEAMATANWAFIEDNEEDPAEWRIESIDHHPGEPAVTYCFNDARVPVDKGAT